MANTLIGFRVFHHGRGLYLTHDPVSGRNFLTSEEPAPVGRSDAHRRIAAWLDEDPRNDDDFSVDPVHRELTPLESTAKELGSLLSSLVGRHGLNLGLSQDQIENRIAQELRELGASPVVEQINRMR